MVFINEKCEYIASESFTKTAGIPKGMFRIFLELYGVIDLY